MDVRTKSRRTLEQRVTKLEEKLHALQRAPEQGLPRQVQYAPNSLIGHLETITAELQELQRNAQALHHTRVAFNCLRERTRIIEVVARLRGELESRAPQNNFVNVNFDLETSRRVVETFFARRKTLGEDGNERS